MRESKSKEESITISNLNFTRLIVHEIAQVSLRHTLNDFNVSTTSLNKSTVNKSLEIIEEAGCYAEEKLFKGRIDWLASTIKGFNINYCEQFMECLLENKKVDFDLESSKTSLDSTECAIYFFARKSKINDNNPKESK